MKKRFFAGLGLMALVLAALFVISSTDLVIKEKQHTVYRVAVLVDSADDTGWENFRMGMDRAALDIKEADISFVTLYDEGETHQQKDLLQREIDGGTQGIILKTENLAYQKEMLEKVPVSMPVVLYGTAFDSPRVKGVIAPGLETMMQKLARTMLNDAGGPGKKISIVTQSDDRADIERMIALLTPILEENGEIVDRVILAAPEDDLTLINRLIARGDSMVFAPELRTALQLSAAIGGRGDQLPLYGCGWSSAVRQALERDSMRASAVFDEYVAGYLAVQQIVAQLSGKKIPDPAALRTSVVTASTIYSRQNEAMLFPIT